MSTKNSKFELKQNFLPYHPALGLCLGGILPAIIMVQLEFFFEMNKGQFKNGFYKYLQQPKGKAKDGRCIELPNTYRKGDSWTEWLSCSPHEFKSAFSKIGMAFGSVTSFNNACGEGDPFQQRFYLSVVDHNTNLTNYYRNHHVVDTFINLYNSTTVPPSPLFLQSGDKGERNSSSLDSIKEVLHRDEPNIPPCSEITAADNSEINLNPHSPRMKSPPSVSVVGQNQIEYDWSCTYSNEDGFRVGKSLLNQYKKYYPLVENAPGGVESFIEQKAAYLKYVGLKRTQLGKGNWSPRTWLEHKLGDAQQYIGDVDFFGKEFADQQRRI